MMMFMVAVISISILILGIFHILNTMSLSLENIFYITQ